MWSQKKPKGFTFCHTQYIDGDGRACLRSWTEAIEIQVQKRVGLAHISELVTGSVFETKMRQKCQVKLKI